MITDPVIEATIGCIAVMNDPAAIFGLDAATVRNTREAFGDLMRVLLNTVPHRQSRLKERGRSDVTARRSRRLAASRGRETWGADCGILPVGRSSTGG